MKAVRLDASIFLVLAMILVLVGGGLVAWFSTRTDPVEEALSGDRIINTMIVIEKDGKPISTHVLMYYPATRRAAIFDVPGDVGQIIRSLGRVDRIDALYKTRSPKPYIEEVGNLLGVEIPFFISIDDKSFSRFVDLVDGMEIFIPDEISIYDSNPMVLLPSGSVVLDGAKAGTFLRFEFPEEDDAQRYTRRQRLNIALLKRLAEKNSYLERSDVRARFHSCFRTNMSSGTFSRLLRELSGLDADRLSPQRVAGNQKDVSGHQLLFPFYDGALIKDIVKQSLASLSRVGEGGALERVHTVEVLNGTPNPGLARKTAELLQGFGYDTITVGNAEKTNYDHTEIMDRSGNAEAARVFADVIHCQTIRTDPRVVNGGAPVEGGADFTIIVGKDFNGRYVIR